jgi:hypothetical protein
MPGIGKLVNVCCGYIYYTLSSHPVQSQRHLFSMPNPNPATIILIRDLSWKLEMSPTCRDMSATTQRVAPILARWVCVADTKFKISWQFVSARADILPNFRNSYVETYYYGMGVHTHRYCHVLLSVMFSHMKQKLPQHFSTQPRTQPHTMSDSTIRPCLLQRLWVQ